MQLDEAEDPKDEGNYYFIAEVVTVVAYACLILESAGFNNVYPNRGMLRWRDSFNVVTLIKAVL